MTSVAYAALWVFVFAVPWDRLIVLPGMSVMTKLTGGVALLLTVFAIVVSGRVRRWRLFQIAAFLFVAWAGAEVWMQNATNIPLKFYTFVQLFIVVGMVWELAPTEKRLRGLLTAYVLGSAVPALATILLFVREHGSLRRFSANGDPNSLAMTLALAMPMAWYLSLTTERPLYRWMLRAYMPLGLLASALTGSRGGMIAWLVALAIIPLTMALSPGRLATAIALLGICASLVVAYVPDKVVERLGSTGSSVESVSLGGRFRLWVAGVHAFNRQPMLGYGVGSFKNAITPELGADALVAHNSFLSVLVEEGIVGLVIYLTMLGAVGSSILRLPRLERRFALVLFATLITAMLPLTWEDQKQVWFITSALIGISAPMVLRQRLTASQTARVGPRWVPTARPLQPTGVKVPTGRGARA